MQCPTCGSRVPDDADVCPDCGMDLQNAAALTPPSPAANVALVENDAPANADDAAAVTPFEFDFDAPAAPTPQSAPPAPAASAAPSATLTLKRGGALTGEIFAIGAMAAIGRFDPESGPVDVDMANLPEASYVSRHHAEISCRNGQWRVKDLGSRNGTFVRPASGGAFARVSGEHPLDDGDEVSLGNARFEFRSGE